VGAATTLEVVSAAETFDIVGTGGADEPVVVVVPNHRSHESVLSGGIIVRKRVQPSGRRRMRGSGFASFMGWRVSKSQRLVASIDRLTSGTRTVDGFVFGGA
jgi:hypothetical protein